MVQLDHWGRICRGFHLARDVSGGIFGMDATLEDTSNMATAFLIARVITVVERYITGFDLESLGRYSRQLLGEDGFVGSWT